MPQYSVEQREQLTTRAVELRVKGWAYAAIAEEIGVVRDTARRWIEAEHARRSEHRSVSDAREHAISVYETGMKAAWERLARMKDSSTNVVGLLNNIRQFQERIDKLTGVETPIKYQEVEDEVEIFWDDGYPLEEDEEAGNAPATAP